MTDKITEELIRAVVTVTIANHNVAAIPFIRESLGNSCFAKAHPNWRSFSYRGKVKASLMDMVVTSEEATFMKGSISFTGTPTELGVKLAKFKKTIVPEIRERNKGPCSIEVRLNIEVEENVKDFLLELSL